MYLNKWIQFAMSLVVVLTGAMAGFDWTTVFSTETSAKIAGAVGIIKLITNAIAPSATVAATPTGRTIVTHVDAKA